jgi:hypothetical protein
LQTHNSNNTRKRTKRKNKDHVKTGAHVIAFVCLAIAGGHNADADRIITGTGQETFSPEPGSKGTE